MNEDVVDEGKDLPDGEKEEEEERIFKNVG